MRPDREQTFALDFPLDLSRTLLTLSHGRGDPTTRLDLEGGVWRATRTPEGPATFRAVAAAPDGVALMAWGEGAGWVIDHGAELLGLHDDPSALVPRHAVVRDLARRSAGMRLTRGTPVLEMVLPTILGQRVTGKEGQLSWRMMTRALGEPAPGPGELTLPPAPLALLRVPRYAFHRFGVEAKRADALLEVCRVRRHVEATAAMTPEDAFARLCLIRGVGPWTAATALAKAMGWADAVPLGDANLPNTVALVLAGEERADDARMLELLAPYEGQRWRVIRLLKGARVKAPRRAPRPAMKVEHLDYDAHGRPRRK